MVNMKLFRKFKLEHIFLFSKFIQILQMKHDFEIYSIIYLKIIIHK
jgi:hypothetical protein